MFEGYDGFSSFFVFFLFFLSRGFLGLADPRTQNIPLILETPSFEQPEAVGGTEIAVLQRISGVQQDLPGEDDLKVFISEIKDAKQDAELRKPKRKKQVPSKMAGPKRRSENKDEEHEDEEEHE